LNEFMLGISTDK